jgi:hypothetical protein
MRERERLMGGESIAQEMLWEDDGAPVERDEQGKVKKQRVFVLDGGFVQWQQKYVDIPKWRYDTSKANLFFKKTK